MSKKTWKFLIATVLSTFLFGLAGCGRTKCDLCTKTKYCEEYMIAYETFTMCDDCYTAWINGTPLAELLRYE